MNMSMGEKNIPSRISHVDPGAETVRVVMADGRGGG